jgi:hypothetical protein
MKDQFRKDEHRLTLVIKAEEATQAFEIPNA